ncbi:hypothetical protein JB92DRAFT_2935184 [Gautieria morchelliformis]|nr:hypothetical protein JB92DRAFT_2935184 [Gautieria morchelliformis]
MSGDQGHAWPTGHGAGACRCARLDAAPRGDATVLYGGIGAELVVHRPERPALLQGCTPHTYGSYEAWHADECMLDGIDLGLHEARVAPPRYRPLLRRVYCNAVHLHVSAHPTLPPMFVGCSAYYHSTPADAQACKSRSQIDTAAPPVPSRPASRIYPPHSRGIRIHGPRAGSREGSLGLGAMRICPARRARSGDGPCTHIRLCDLGLGSRVRRAPGRHSPGGVRVRTHPVPTGHRPNPRPCPCQRRREYAV